MAGLTDFKAAGLYLSSRRCHYNIISIINKGKIWTNFSIFLFHFFFRYVPPSLRDGGGTRRGETMGNPRQARDDNTVRVTNLSEDIRERDIQELFSPFGQIQRIYLAKDKVTNNSKGFAFVSFLRKDAALSAIMHLNGYGYDNLILSVEMANKPNN